MVAKFILLLASLVALAYAIEEIQLPDETTTYLSNPLIAKSIGIGKLFLDKLVSCHVIFPNGAFYEAFPNSNVPESSFIYNLATSDLHSCSMAFRNAPPELSGTYELLSMVDHTLQNTRTLTRQRYHLTFYYSDSWQVPQDAEVKA